MKFKSWNFGYEKEVRLKQWHKWFAWYPVVLAEEHPGQATCKHWAWWEQVDRRATIFSRYNRSWNYEYRERNN